MSIIYIYILKMWIYYINPFVRLLTGCQQAYTISIKTALLSTIFLRHKINLYSK